MQAGVAADVAGPTIALGGTGASGGSAAPLAIPAGIAIATVGEVQIVNGVVAAGAGIYNVKQALNRGGGGGSPYNAGNFRQNLANLTGINPPNAQAHHVFPQKFEAEFKKLDIDIHDPKFGAWWDTAQHQQSAYAYNQLWDRFFSSGNVTNAGAMNFARGLASSYGLTIYF